MEEEIHYIVKNLYGVDVRPVITAAPKNIDADYSCNVAMTLARELHKSPMEIASEIAKEYGDGVEIAPPGFLNFISSDDNFKEKLADFGGKFTKNISCGDINEEYDGKTVICEFSDPNPFKVLHVGHLYTSIVGDSISRMLEFAGAKVVRANFGGDVGLHVAKTLWAVLNDDVALDDLTIEIIAEKYVKGTNAYEENEEAKKEIVRINKAIYEIALEGEYDSDDDENLEDGGAVEEDLLREKLAKYYWKGREISYKYFEDFYAKIGVKFDKYYPESTVAMRGLAEVKNGLKDGVYEESDGAIVYKGEKKDLHTRVFINNAGLPTYEAKDVGLIFTKWDDYKFDKSIVITGNDIIDYMKVVLSSVAEMKPELTERTLHLTHGNVRLPGNEKMSSRKGNFIKAVDVLEAVRNECQLEAGMRMKEKMERIRPDVTIDPDFSAMKVDRKVVMGAIKYAFLKYKVGGNIEFDVESSVSMTGNSGPYLQYSAVRAQKILANMMKDGITKAGDDEWVLDEHEKSMIKKVVEYPNILSEAVAELAPSKICTYLYELAQEFSRFYENVKVAGSHFEYERGQIVLAYLKVMTHGLNLLGIEVPEKM
ncbi:MAG: arginine--tRNA ligase [Candidatus Saccharibacteria bacterium]|nr:arginine--tRNA ligase [Candidatus Saccharibacteria bacterium]